MLKNKIQEGRAGFVQCLRMEEYNYLHMAFLAAIAQTGVYQNKIRLEDIKHTSATGSFRKEVFLRVYHHSDVELYLSDHNLHGCHDDVFLLHAHNSNALYHRDCLSNDADALSLQGRNKQYHRGENEVKHHALIITY